MLCTQEKNVASLRVANKLGFVEVDRFEEFGERQRFGVRRSNRHRPVHSFRESRSHTPHTQQGEFAIELVVDFKLVCHVRARCPASYG